MPTLLCVPILVHDLPAALADAKQARHAGADLVEFRIDEFFTGSAGDAGDEEQRAVLRLVAESPLPCIITCRAGAEGGHYDGDETARVSLLERLGTAQRGSGDGAEHPPRYIDVELATYTRSANLKQKINLAVDHPGQVRDVRTSLILSVHDFTQRPADLLRRIARMRAEPGAAVLKIAYRARSLRDNLELFDILAEADRPTIALAMGEFGLMSRVLAPKFGGFLTFASLSGSSATAPGQPTIGDLLTTYRFRSIAAGTYVYGVIGWPVAHSLSPLMHNAGFEAVGHDGVYLPLPVPPEYEHFKATLGALIDHPRLTFCGCSVTIPHKEHLVRFAREHGDAWSIDALSDACDAANTLTIRRGGDGRFVSAGVSNTDGPAAIDCLTGPLGPLAGKRIAIIGAGGAGRAIGAALVLTGATVIVHNRTRPRAEALVKDLLAKLHARPDQVLAADLADLPASACHAVINCTPVGMAGGPAPNDLPIDPEQLRNSNPAAVVFDTVYRPRRTPLLERAAAAGLRTIDGLSMLVAQGARQFAQWTGREAPRRLFERIGGEAMHDPSSA